MKYSILALTALAALSQAQSAPTVPECATKCIADAITRNTDCNADDFACACLSADDVLGDSALAACLVKACDGNDLDNVVESTAALCGEVVNSLTSSLLSSTTSAPTSTTTATVPGNNNTTTTTRTKTTSTDEDSPTSPSDGGDDDGDKDDGGDGDGGNGDDSAAATLGPISGIVMLVLGMLAL